MLRCNQGENFARCRHEAIGLLTQIVALQQDATYQRPTTQGEHYLSALDPTLLRFKRDPRRHSCRTHCSAAPAPSPRGGVGRADSQAAARTRACDNCSRRRLDRHSTPFEPSPVEPLVMICSVQLPRLLVVTSTSGTGADITNCAVADWLYFVIAADRRTDSDLRLSYDARVAN
jgi:hypothetical protein